MSSTLALSRRTLRVGRAAGPKRGAPVAAAKEVTMPALSSTMTEGKVSDEGMGKEGEGPGGGGRTALASPRSRAHRREAGDRTRPCAARSCLPARRPCQRIGTCLALTRRLCGSIGGAAPGTARWPPARASEPLASVCGARGCLRERAPRPLPSRFGQSHASRAETEAGRTARVVAECEACVAGARRQAKHDAARESRETRGRRALRSRPRRLFRPSPPPPTSQVVSWLKQPGDKVKKGEAVVVIESDKADMEVESFSAGTLAAVVVAEGGVAPVGTPIAFIAETGRRPGRGEAAGCRSGGWVARRRLRLRLRRPRPRLRPPPAAPAAAPAAPAAPAPVAAAPAPVAAPAFVPRADGRVIATPFAKKLAREAGRGPRQSAWFRGLLAASRLTTCRRLSQAAPRPAAAAPARCRRPGCRCCRSCCCRPRCRSRAASALAGTTQPFSAMQLAVAKNMNASLAVPEFRVAMKVTTDALDALYKRVKPKGVTMSALLAKAVGVALASHPLLYASTTPDGTATRYNDAINVAMAVAMPDGGLITPVLKNADSTDLYQLSRNWGDLVKRARGKALSPDEYNWARSPSPTWACLGWTRLAPSCRPGTGAILAGGWGRRRPWWRTRRGASRCAR